MPKGPFEGYGPALGGRTNELTTKFPAHRPNQYGPAWDIEDYRPVMDVEVRHSGIEGSGVFASRSFAVGETIRVVNIVREITADAPLRSARDEHVEHCNWHHPEGQVVLRSSLASASA